MSNTGIFLLVIGLAISSFGLGVNVSHKYDNERVEKASGNSIENMENLKRDCEKSLPRDKVCVMVFGYVPAEADYE